jgi:hypothetical protein
MVSLSSTADQGGPQRGATLLAARASGVFLSLLLLAALLASCSISTQGEATLEPLQNTAWPTPRPTAVQPSPTPFPKVDPALVRRLDDRSAAAPAEGSLSLTPEPLPSAETVRASRALAETSALDAMTATATPTVVAPSARVRGPKGVNVRSGPGTSFPVIAGLRAGDSVTVLGVNEEDRDWVYIRTAAGKQGWVYLPLFDPSGSLDGVPAAPAISASQSEIPSAPQVAGSQSTTPARTAGAAAGTGRAQSLLVFQLSSGGDIMVVNGDGSGLRGLTHGIDPVLSPDGQRVAFTRWDGTDGSLWVIDVDGGNEHQVTGGIAQAKHPTWSPDGKRVAVTLQHQGRLDPARKCASLASGEVPGIPWNVDPDSVGVEVRGQYPYLIPYLCYTAPPDPHWSVRIVDVANGDTEDQVTDTYAFGPEWDPANPWRIVTSGLNGLTQMDVNRQAVWALSDRREDHTPAFSPDGRYIAVAYNNGGHYVIHRLDAGGGGRVALTKPPLWLIAEGRQPWNDVAPAWSPDGTRIAFLTDRNGRWEIWVMDADGSNPRPMFDEALNAQLHFAYDFVDERMLSWAGR